MTYKNEDIKSPGELELFTGVVLVIVIVMQIDEYYRTGCFSFAANSEICGEWVNWFVWVVVAFEAAFPIATAYKYYKVK